MTGDAVGSPQTPAECGPDAGGPQIPADAPDDASSPQTLAPEEERLLPRYPVYVISKGRPNPNASMSTRWMRRDRTDFRLVVEPQEAEEYAAYHGEDRLEVLPFSNLGLGSIPARNWCWEHARENGAARHWIVDDNIRGIWRAQGGRRNHCDSAAAFWLMEEFVDRYTNVGMAGPNYVMFGIGASPPFRLNAHVYSCLLIDNEMPYRWRGRYNEDTDLCLQVLSGGLCTVQFNIFLAQKVGTMVMKGGNTDELYQGDGRLRMARSLERVWPGVATTDRRFRRPQHVIARNWKAFDTPLIRREDLDWDEIARTPLDPLRIKRLRAERPRVDRALNAALKGRKS